MQIEIEMITQPIQPRRELPAALAGLAGAVAEFTGIVRAEENGRPVAALEYEAYAPMAEREMRRIIEAVGREHPCLAVRVIHRVGVIPVGEAAIYVAAFAPHRAEAFAMLTKFMDRLKQDVPIWKVRAIEQP
ncbi:MAG: molybdenum cofactor biosynthesis protein MoaE [Verrucomicrobiia bacterium]|jgi:molybdopterin synthase catalytic subunit